MHGSHICKAPGATGVALTIGTGAGLLWKTGRFGQAWQPHRPGAGRDQCCAGHRHRCLIASKTTKGV